MQIIQKMSLKFQSGKPVKQSGVPEANSPPDGINEGRDVRTVRKAREVLHTLFQSPFRAWIIIFLFSNAVIDLDYGTNPDSRFAALCAMAEDHSFRINNYKDLTIDWSRTPDGDYYSNKAPGPVLIAFPMFWLIDQIVTSGTTDRAARDEARLGSRRLTLRLLSFAFQSLPFSVLVLLALAWLEARGCSRAALHLGCVAMLFGNTASLFMNTYFGHGMAAVCVIALCLALIKRWYFWSGMAYGLALLTDYGAALLLPGFIAAAMIQVSSTGRWRTLIQIAAGGLLTGVLWLLYHVSCFGGSFTLPNRYQNPIFVDQAQNQIFGIFNAVPSLAVLGELLFGQRRGILWSQPWLLIVLAGIPFTRHLLRGFSSEARKALKAVFIFLIPGFVLLLAMNASFGQWQGGSTPGPRYLCLVFPAFGLLIPVLYDRLSLAIRRLIVLSIIISVAFWILAFSSHILVPSGETMWGFFFRSLLNSASNSSLIRFLALTWVFQWQWLRVWRELQLRTAALTQV